MTSFDEITVGTWNTEWAPSSGIRATMVRDRLTAATADVLVVTEGRRDLLPGGGHMADGGDDWGYGKQRDRRKVILWSRWPLTDIEYIDSGGGAGRVISALTAAPTGPIRTLAVCIPWSRAHVSTGRRDASSWSEHLDCLDQLEALVARFDTTVPTVVAGDFNQRVPRGKQRADVAARLAEVLDRWVVHTAGDVEHGPLIDHIASDLQCTEVRTWSGRAGERRLSDHSGVVCRLAPPPHV